MQLATFPRTLVLVTSPSAIRQVLAHNEENYARGAHWQRAKALLGEGLATADGETWRRQRAIALPAFQHDRVTRAIPFIHSGLEKVCQSWEATTLPVEVTLDLVRLATHVVLRGLLNVDLQPDAAVLHQALSVASRHLSQLVIAPWGRSRWLLSGTSRRYRSAMGVLEELVGQIMTCCRDRPDAGDDLVSILLRSQNMSGKPLPDRRIRDELVTILTAAVETQVSVLIWLLVVLATHPRIHAELHAEARSDGEFTTLKRARQTVDETLRLYPSGWIFDRVALQDDTLDGVRIRKGTTVLICPYATHRSPAWWPDPNRFDPDRFLPDRAPARDSFAYLPFGRGPRTCIGAPFAIALATLFVSRIAERFTCTVSAPPALVPRAGALLKPPAGIRFQFRPIAGRDLQTRSPSAGPSR